MKTFQQIIILFFISFGLWVFVQTIDARDMGLKPGLWEIEFIMEIPNQPQGGIKNKMQQCIKEQEASKGPVFSDFTKQNEQQRCQMKNIQYPKKGSISYDMVCDGKTTKIKVDYQSTDTSYESIATVETEGEKYTYKYKGRYLGPCKK